MARRLMLSARIVPQAVHVADAVRDIVPICPKSEEGQVLDRGAPMGRPACSGHMHFDDGALFESHIFNGRKMPFSYLAGIVIVLPTFRTGALRSVVASGPATDACDGCTNVS